VWHFKKSGIHYSITFKNIFEVAQNFFRVAHVDLFKQAPAMKG
jgi:hypothetical protein